MKLTNINELEKQNENIAVNVHGYEPDFYATRISEEIKKGLINLLLISDVHYGLMKSMSRLLASQTPRIRERKNIASGVWTTPQAKKSFLSLKSIAQEIRQSGSRCQIRVV